MKKGNLCKVIKDDTFLNYQDKNGSEYGIKLPVGAIIQYEGSTTDSADRNVHLFSFVSKLVKRRYIGSVYEKDNIDCSPEIAKKVKVEGMLQTSKGNFDFYKIE